MSKDIGATTVCIFIREVNQSSEFGVAVLQDTGVKDVYSIVDMNGKTVPKIWSYELLPSSSCSIVGNYFTYSSEGGAYTHINLRSGEVTTDGKFTLEELEAIVSYLKGNKIRDFMDNVELLCRE